MFAFNPVTVAPQCHPRVIRQIETNECYQVYIKKADGDFSSFEVSAVLCNGGASAKVLVELGPDDFEFSVQLPVETTDLKHTHLILKDPVTLVLQVQKKKKQPSPPRTAQRIVQPAPYAQHQPGYSQSEKPLSFDELLRVLHGHFGYSQPVHHDVHPVSQPHSHGHPLQHAGPHARHPHTHSKNQQYDVLAALQQAAVENRRKEAVAQQSANFQKQKEAALAKQRKQQKQAALLEAKRQASIAEAHKHLRAAEAKREAAIAEAHRQFVISAAKRNKSIADIAKRQQELLEQQRQERAEARQNKHVFDVLAAAIAAVNAQEEDDEPVAPRKLSDARRNSAPTWEKQQELLQKWQHALERSKEEATEDTEKISQKEHQDVADAIEAERKAKSKPSQQPGAQSGVPHPAANVITPAQLAQLLGGILPASFMQRATPAEANASLASAPAPAPAPVAPSVVEPESPYHATTDVETPEESGIESPEASPVTTPNLTPASPATELHRVPSIEEVEDEEFVLFKKRFGDH